MLQAAYAKPTYAEARDALQHFMKTLEQHNDSAAWSLEEGLDETLTVLRVEVFTTRGISFRTTMLIEGVMAPVEAKTRRITRGRTSDQKRRWCAATLLEIDQ